jgi:hypothetical protein
MAIQQAQNLSKSQQLPQMFFASKIFARILAHLSGVLMSLWLRIPLAWRRTPRNFLEPGYLSQPWPSIGSP